MDPLPRSIMPGRTARQVWNDAVRSVRRISSHTAGVMSRNGLTWRPPGVVDEGIDPSEDVDDLGDEALRLGTVTDVRAKRLGVDPELAGALHGAPGPVLGVEVVDGDGRALRRRLGGDLGADAPAAPRHEDDAAGQQIAGHAADPAVRTKTGSRPSRCTSNSSSEIARTGAGVGRQ